MAVTNQEVVFTFNAETGEVEKVTTRLVKDMEKVADAADDAAKATEEIGKNAKTAGTGLKKAGTLGAQGFKALGTAIKATGIGLLVGLVVKLVQKFTENKAVAEALEVAFAAIGAVINVIVDAAAPLGDLLIDIFTNPQQVIEDLKAKLTDLFGSPKEALLNFANLVKENIINRFEGMLELIPKLAEAIGLLFEGRFGEAGKVAADAAAKVTLGVENITDKVVEATEAVTEFVTPFVEGAVKQAKAAVALEKQMQALTDRQRELNVATAQGAAEVEELKRQSDDQRLSVEERIEAATRAAELNQRFADENVAIANERAALLRQELELQGETEERLQAVADAEIEAAAARQASATIQTELQNKLFALNQELLAQEEERLAAAQDELAARQELEDELYALTLSAREREELALMQQYDERIAIAGDDEGLIRAATEQLNADLAAIEQEYQAQSDAQGDAQRQSDLDKELANAEAIKQARLDITKSTLNALSALNEAFTGESEQEQKKGFERSKKIQTAQALISTYESAVQAFKSLAGIPVVGPGLGTAAAVAAVAGGLANVKKIQSQTFQGGAGGGGSSYSGTGGAASAATAAAQTPPAPTLDLGFLGEGAQSQVIETYVISENVTSAQQANKKIQDQSTL